MTWNNKIKNCGDKFNSHKYLPDETDGSAALLPGTGGIFSKGGRGGMRGQDEAGSGGMVEVSAGGDGRRDVEAGGCGGVQ